MTRSGKLAALMRALSWRQVAAELRETESRFRQVTENIREVFFLVDPGMTRMFYVSPGYEELWGRSCESLYANPRSFGDAIHVDDRERAFLAFAPQGTVIPFDVEYRVVRPDGTVRWVRARGFPICDARGQIYRFAGIAEDITERKDALDQVTRQARLLEQSNRRLALLGEMTGMLQTVVRIEEAASIIQGNMAQLELGDGGAFYLFRESRNHLDLLARWGEPKLADGVVPGECWALRRGQPYRSPGAQPSLRWWAEKVGKAGVIPADNTRLGIPERRFVTHENKARELGGGLDRVHDPHVRMSLELQQAFGPRREERCWRTSKAPKARWRAAPGDDENYVYAIAL